MVPLYKCKLFKNIKESFLCHRNKLTFKSKDNLYFFIIYSCNLCKNKIFVKSDTIIWHDG